MFIEHVAIRVKNIEKMRSFYQKYFNCISNEKYTNKTKQFESCFLIFENGARLELIKKPDTTEDLEKKTLNLSDVNFLIDEYYPVARDILLSFNSVSSYYELFKSLFTFKKVLNCCEDNCLSLYRKNFILQHILYKLQFEFYKDFNFALIIDSNLLFFDKIPEPPSFFSISKCKFIKLSEPIHHFNRDNLPTINGLRDYYFDLSNFLNAREDSVKDAIDIGLKIAIDPAILTDALNIFGLSLSSLTLEKVKKRYHRLLKLHHPDKTDERSLGKNIKNNSKFTIDKNPAEDSENFEIIKIIEAYQILKSLFI